MPYGGCRVLNWHVGFRGCQLTPIDEGHDGFLIDVDW